MSAHAAHTLVESLGWTLLHFVWQGALVALVLWLLLAGLAGASSRARYLLRCAAFTLMVLSPALTFAWLWSGAPPEQVVEGLAPAPTATSPSDVLSSTWSQPLTWVVAAWCLGALVCLVRISGGLYQVLRLGRRSVGIDLSPRWQQRFESLAHDFGVRARARVVESSAVCVPAVIGCVRPVVMLPARIFSGLSDAQIEALIAHELAHVARHDYLVNIVQSVAEALLFYHPAVWWVSRGIRVEREYCCDDLAVAATQNGLAYAHALTALESWRGAQPQLGVSTLGGSLMTRIQRLVGLEPTPQRGALRPAHALAGLVVAGSLGASAFALTSLPEPALHDCECACHSDAAPKRARRDPAQRQSIELHAVAPQSHARRSAPRAERQVQVIIKRIDEDGNEYVIERDYSGGPELHEIEHDLLLHDFSTGSDDVEVEIFELGDLGIDLQELEVLGGAMLVDPQHAPHPAHPGEVDHVIRVQAPKPGQSAGPHERVRIERVERGEIRLELDDESGDHHSKPHKTRVRRAVPMKVELHRGGASLEDVLHEYHVEVLEDEPMPPMRWLGAAPGHPGVPVKPGVRRAQPSESVRVEEVDTGQARVLFEAGEDGLPSRRVFMGDAGVAPELAEPWIVVEGDEQEGVRVLLQSGEDGLPSRRVFMGRPGGPPHATDPWVDDGDAEALMRKIEIQLDDVTDYEVVEVELAEQELLRLEAEQLQAEEQVRAGRQLRRKQRVDALHAETESLRRDQAGQRSEREALVAERAALQAELLELRRRMKELQRTMKEQGLDQ
jgi:beta-lactamase regulating signal transducer with metallopeptidase domain